MHPKFEIPDCDNCIPRAKSIFNELTGEEFFPIAENKGCHQHRAGQVLFYEGDLPLGLYCINKGKVKIYKTGEDGKEHIVRLAKEGDVVGYRALISGERYNASAAVLEDAVDCFIPKDVIFSLLQTNKNFAMRMINVLSRDVGLAEERLVHMAQKPVRERLAEALLLLKEFYGYEEDKQTIKGSMSREDIANIVGTATETVIRLLSEFREEKIIETVRRKIKIIDQNALIKTARVFD